MSSDRLLKGSAEFRGETYVIREWTPIERSEFFKRVKDDPTLAAAYLAHRCTLTDTGAPRWPKESDVSAKESPALSDHLSLEICKLSGVDLAKAKDEEEPQPKKD